MGVSDAVHALFASPVYAGDDRPTSGRGEAAYWLPIIALYTGARLEEIAQLRVTDVRQEPYLDGNDREQFAWVICVMQEEGLSTKNANSERRIPVHPHATIVDTFGSQRVTQGWLAVLLVVVDFVAIVALRPWLNGTSDVKLWTGLLIVVGVAIAALATARGFRRKSC